ncbi:hypothetical protein ABZ815_05170 [Nonomuraea sp. NPDC047529]|uniref:alpha/beta hydrolase family protein n=1 Tax=Nonomuraea sp. NPDC047529 TaxID=3155623 RepID=UPI0033EAB423
MRMLIISAMAILTMSACSSTSSSAADQSGKPTPLPGITSAQLTLPPPTGPNKIGTRMLRLVDSTRRDDWVEGQPVRELMVQLWYPTSASSGTLAPYMAKGAEARTRQINAIPDEVKLPVTHAYLNAPIAPGAHPVIVYAHGSHDTRTGNTVLVEELASHGYQVVTIDHTHYAEEVEFPDGRIVDEVKDPDTAHEVATRVADVRFVLNQLDLARVGMFGASFGGVETVAAMHDDPRIIAGVNLDGPWTEPIFGDVSRWPITKPLLSLTSAQADSHPPLSGRVVRLAGAQHLTFSDGEWLDPNPTPEQYGTIDPQQALHLERKALLDFFSQTLH